MDAANTQLNANVVQLNAALSAGKASSAAPSKNLSIGLTPRELKLAILNNLRQVDAARSQYKLEKGTDPDSVATLVGDRAYIRRLSTVAGEDYSSLSMGAGQVLTATTPDGTVVTYDPSGAATTAIEPPSVLESAEDLMKAVGPAITQAVAAYRAGNQGQMPPNPEALTPYFASPQDAAAFAQAREALRAAQKPSH